MTKRARPYISKRGDGSGDEMAVADIEMMQPGFEAGEYDGEW